MHTCFLTENSTIAWDKKDILSYIDKLDITKESDQYYYHKLLSQYSEHVYVNNILNMSNESILSDAISLFKKGIAPLFNTNLFFSTVKIFENIRKLLYNGIRLSNLLFHKTEYARWRKFNFISYRKIMDLPDSVLNTIPVYRPSLLLTSDLTVVAPIILDAISVLPDNGRLSEITDTCIYILGLIKKGHTDYDEYLGAQKRLSMYNITDLRSKMDKLTSIYGSSPDLKSKDDLYPFTQVYKNKEGFSIIDHIVDTIEPQVKRVTTVADKVEYIESVFRKTTSAIQSKDIILDKNTILVLADISDVLGRVFSLYGMGMHSGMELIHNHTLNLERIRVLAL